MKDSHKVVNSCDMERFYLEAYIDRSRRVQQLRKHHWFSERRCIRGIIEKFKPFGIFAILKKALRCSHAARECANSEVRVREKLFARRPTDSRTHAYVTTEMD